MSVPASHGGSVKVLSPQRSGISSTAQCTPPMGVIGLRRSSVDAPFCPRPASHFVDLSSELSQNRLAMRLPSQLLTVPMVPDQPPEVLLFALSISSPR